MTEVELHTQHKWTDAMGKNTSTHMLPPTLSVVYCTTGKPRTVKMLNYRLHHRHGNLQLEEEDAVEGMAHGSGEEEVAKQMKVGLQTLGLVVQRYLWL